VIRVKTFRLFTVLLCIVLLNIFNLSCFIHRAIKGSFNGPYVTYAGHELLQFCIDEKIIPNCRTTMYAEQCTFDLRNLQLQPDIVPKSIAADMYNTAEKDKSEMYWNPKLINKITFTAPDSSTSFWISRPVFSADTTYAIIQHGYHCGPLCGTSSVELLQKISNRWKFIKEIEAWDS